MTVMVASKKVKIVYSYHQDGHLPGDVVEVDRAVADRMIRNHRAILAPKAVKKNDTDTDEP